VANAPKLTELHAEFQKFSGMTLTPQNFTIGRGQAPSKLTATEGLQCCAPPVFQRQCFAARVVPLLAIRNMVTLI